MNEEDVKSAEYPDVDPNTLDQLLTRIQAMVGDKPVEKNASYSYPGVPRGVFLSRNEEDRFIDLAVQLVPLEKSHRGEVAIVKRMLHPTQEDPVVSGYDKQYYFFNEGGDIRLEGLVTTDEPEKFEDSTDYSDVTGFDVAIKQVHFQTRARQRWYEQQLEEQRVSGESRVYEVEAQQLLAQLERAVPAYG